MSVKEVKRGVWRQRRRRMVTGVNVVVAVLLMSGAVLLLNILVSRFPYRILLESRAHHELSSRTMGLLEGLETEVDLVAFLSSDATLYDDVRVLLREYEYVAKGIDGLNLRLEIVDPSRDIARTRELALKYDVSKEDVIVFSCGGRKKYVEVSDLAQYEIKLSERGIAKNMIGFFGEQSFSSAILSVTQDETPVIYFVTGHGERRIDDFGRKGGFSGVAREIRRDNMDARVLHLAEHGKVPDDCEAIVVAGPDRKFADIEIRYINDYLKNRHGRVMFMLDPSVNAGLSGLLNEWGVALGKGVAAGLTLSGRELVIREYGDHPITRAFNGVSTMFYMPRPVVKTESARDEGSGHGEEDRARVTVLASTGKEGWIEHDLSQEPPRYDSESDGSGPVSVAVAVEKGALGVDVEIKSTRMVVIGDSYFVSNAALDGGVGGNVSFFLSSLNWLVERESLLRVSPRPPMELNPDMSIDQWRKLFLLAVVMVPGIIALIGVVVWWRRRS